MQIAGLWLKVLLGGRFRLTRFRYPRLLYSLPLMYCLDFFNKKEDLLNKKALLIMKQEGLLYGKLS